MTAPLSYSPDVLTAFHESGHTLAYLVRDVKFDHVTIRPGVAGVAGMVALDELPSDPKIRALVAHAGPMAESRHRITCCQGPGPLWAGDAERHERAAYEAGGHEDLSVVRGALRTLGLDADPFQAQARELLRVNWPAVQRVAEALTERHTLPHAAIVRLVGELR